MIKYTPNISTQSATTFNRTSCTFYNYAAKQFRSTIAHIINDKINRLIVCTFLLGLDFEFT